MKTEKKRGATNRYFRFSVGIAMMYFAFIDKAIIVDQVSAILFSRFETIIFVTSVISMCILYNRININTSNNEESYI